jgi:predicted secreted protein
MKPKPANLSNIRTPKAGVTQPDSPNNNNILGVVITTAVVTTIVVGSIMLYNNHQLKMRITFLEKEVNETSNRKVSDKNKV